MSVRERLTKTAPASQGYASSPTICMTVATGLTSRRELNSTNATGVASAKSRCPASTSRTERLDARERHHLKVGARDSLRQVVGEGTKGFRGDAIELAADGADPEQPVLTMGLTQEHACPNQRRDWSHRPPLKHGMHQSIALLVLRPDRSRTVESKNVHATSHPVRWSGALDTSLVVPCSRHS